MSNRNIEAFTHRFHDWDLRTAHMEFDGSLPLALLIDVGCSVNIIDIRRGDVIAMAKAFNLTQEELSDVQ